MGQKVHPIGFRLGITTQHTSNWYAEKSQYTENLLKDIEVREHLTKKLSHASVSRIDIERTADNARVLIHTARPGIVIGKKGEDIDKMREDITNRMGVAQQLERRVMFRRAMKRAVQNAMRQGAEGVKIRVAGRLGGAEIARAEIQKEGRVPLHTLRADVDYGLAEANTTYGVIGVKAWVFRGEVLDTQNKDSD